MSNGADKPEVAKWDPGFTRQIKNWVGPIIRRYFRAEVRDLDAMPAVGSALVVSNHSGGMFTPDVLIFAPAFYDKFGFDRPVYTLAAAVIHSAEISSHPCGMDNSTTDMRYFRQLPPSTGNVTPVM